VTKVRAWKGGGWECNLIITFTFLRVQKSVRKWAHTLLNGLPFWELESWWTPKFLESVLRSQNSLDWRLPYTIGKFIRHKSPKHDRIIHLSTFNTSYGWKKDQESKCQFNSWPLKVDNHPELHVCKRHVTYCWKDFDQGYNLAWYLTLIKGFHKTL